MKLLNKHMVWATIALVMMSSCASSKKPTKGKSLTYEQQTNFANAYFEAAKLKTIGDFTGAANKFAEAYKIDPGNHAVTYQLGNLNMGVRNFHDAVYWSERAVKSNPNYNFWYYGQLAQAYNKVADFKKSAEVFKIMIAKEPNRKSNYIEAGNQFINARDFKSAIAVFSDYQKKFGIDEESARKKEGLYFELNKPKEGIESMKALVDAFPNEARYQGLLAESYTRNLQYDEAIATYQQIIDKDPQSGYAYFGLADVYRKKGNSDQSFEYLLKGFNDKQVSSELKIKVIGSYYVFVRKDDKMRDQALQLCQKLIEKHPTEANAYIAYADVLHAIGKIEDARNNLVLSTEYDQTDINVWQKLLSLDDELENFQFMVQDSKRALEFYPNHTFLYIINAFANYTIKNYAAAQKASSDGLEISVINKDRIDLLTTLADASHELGQHEKSDAAFEELLELDPKNQTALNNYAYYLALRNEKLEKALTMIKQAIQLNPAEYTYKDTHGWVLYQMGRYDEALPLLKQAYTVMAEEAEVVEHYAMALIKTGDETLGQELLQKAKSMKKAKADNP